MRKRLTQAELDIIIREHEDGLYSYECKGEKAELSDLDLRGLNLLNKDLRGVILRNMDLRDVDLRNTTLCGTIIEDVDLRGANLRSVELGLLDLEGVDLRGADLSSSILGGGRKVPFLLGNVLVTEVEDMDDFHIKIKTWEEVSDDDLPLYKELYG